MSDLSPVAMQYLEVMLGMKTGYVLDYSDSTFYGLFDACGINIATEEYENLSKAQALRHFWKTGDNNDVKILTKALLARWRVQKDENENLSGTPEIYNSCVEELEKLNAMPVIEKKYLVSNIANESYKKAQEAIATNKYEIAISQSRTLLEETLKNYYFDMSKNKFAATDTISKKFKKVAEYLFNSKESEWKKIINSLSNAIEAFAQISNTMSDRHAREENPSSHQAKFIFSITVSLLELIYERREYLEALRKEAILEFKSLNYVRYGQKTDYYKFAFLSDQKVFIETGHQLFKEKSPKIVRRMLINYYLNEFTVNSYDDADKLFVCLILFIEDLTTEDINKLVTKYQNDSEASSKLSYFLEELEAKDANSGFLIRQ